MFNSTPKSVKRTPKSWDKLYPQSQFCLEENQPYPSEKPGSLGMLNSPKKKWKSESVT